MPALDPTARSLYARAAASSRVAREGGHAVAAPAQRAALDRFLDAVDPDRVLPEAERERRAASLRKAYFARLAAKSAQARRRKAGAAERQALADELRAALTDLGGDAA